MGMEARNGMPPVGCAKYGIGSCPPLGANIMDELGGHIAMEGIEGMGDMCAGVAKLVNGMPGMPGIPGIPGIPGR